MKFDRLFRALGPIIAVAMAAGVTACDGNVSINGEKGKPLAEIDLTGTPPEELVLLGPDEVRVTQGDKLAITVEGDQAVTDKLRFTLKDGTLGVLREGKSYDSNHEEGKAVVNVTMPAPKNLTMAGSGKIHAAALAKDAKITIAGSGDIETPNVAGDKLDLTIAGSGS
ncbi:MAG: GIN domain-containing protein, partial [Novosphingobium sp.]